MKSLNLDLGSRLMIYKGRPIKGKEVGALIFMFIIFTATPFLIGIYRTLYGYAQFGPAASSSWGIPYLAISMVAFSVLLIYCIIRLDSTITSIAIYKSGLKIKKLLKKEHIIRWDEITALYVSQEHREQVNKISRMKAILYAEKNKRLSIKESQIEGFSDLITQIKSPVYIHLNPILRERFRSGDRISFGPIEIQQKYLKIQQNNGLSKSTELLWSDIDRITVKSGYLLVKLRENKLYRIRTAKIPNIEILLRIVEDKNRL